MPRPAALALLLAGVAPLAAPAAALADRLETASKVDAVSVHPDGAMVTRIAELDLPKGSSTVVVTGLPGFVDAGSLRVTGSGLAGLVLVGQDLGKARPREGAADPKAEARSRELRRTLDDLRGRIDALVAKQKAIQRYAEAQPLAGPDGRPADPESLARGWDAIASSLAPVNAELASLRERLLEAEGEAKAFEARTAEAAPPMADVRQVALAVDAETAGKVRLAMSYPVSLARWGVLYDANLETKGADGKPSLEIVRRALVVQASGEAWEDAALTVETAMMNRAEASGTVDPVRLSLRPKGDDSQQMMEMARSNMPMSALPPLPPGPNPPRRMTERGASAMPTVQGGPAPFPMRPADAFSRPDEDRARLLAAQASVGQVAAAQTNGASHGFVLPARLTVTGDGVGRAVRLGSERLEPRLRIEVAPRLDASARLTARFTWKGDTPLFPGLVSLYNDGVGVGKRGLNLLAPGEELSLPFGVDDLVRVDRLPVKEETTENGVLVNVTKTRSTDLRAKVTNRHAGPVDLHVEDRIPVAESNEIKVERREVSPAPTSEGGKDRPGTLAWDRTLAPGASLDLRVAYAVTWPRSAEIQQSGPVQGPRLNY